MGDKTPAQYIMWRFAGNDDRESLEFKGDEISANEEKLRAVKWMIDPVRLSCRKVENEKEERLAVIPEAILKWVTSNWFNVKMKNKQPWLVYKPNTLPPRVL